MSENSKMETCSAAEFAPPHVSTHRAQVLGACSDMCACTRTLGVQAVTTGKLLCRMLRSQMSLEASTMLASSCRGFLWMQMQIR